MGTTKTMPPSRMMRSRPGASARPRLKAEPLGLDAHEEGDREKVQQRRQGRDQHDLV
jgi:hypothetical protein